MGRFHAPSFNNFQLTQAMKINRPIAALALVAAAAMATSARAQAPASASAAPNETIYVQQLPSPSELASGATAGGVTIEKIDQTSDQITVVYKYTNGQTNTVAYRPIAAAGSAATSGAVIPATTPAPAVSTTQTVIYSEPAPVYYYYPASYYYPTYYPWGWYPPVSLHVGFGFRGGFHGGFGGGFHGHWR